MVDIWAEVWPVPGVTPWQRRIAKLDASVLSGIKRGWLGNGSFQIPVRYPRLDEIIYKDPDDPSNDVESLIRVYMEGITTPVCEFFADQAPNLLADQGTLSFTGYGIESELDKLRVLPFDYPRLPTLDPDWIFGNQRNAVRNGGFEDNPVAIANTGFEDGTRAPWWPGLVEGVNANVVIVTGANVDTGTFAAEVDPLTAEGGISTSIRILPDTEYTVTARVKAAAGVDYQLGASGPESIVPLGGAIFATAFGDGEYGPGQKHEAQTLFVSTGAYQTVTLQFRTGPNQASTQISIREGEAVLNGQVFYIDVVSVSGNGVGVSPWQSVNVTTFQASSAQFDTGAWSGHIVGAGASSGASTGGYVFQQMNGFTLGATYTATARLRSPTATRRWALEIRDVTGALIAQTSVVLAANTWTSLTLTFEVPLFLPGPDKALEIRIGNYHTASTDLFLDTVFLFQGQPATTIGDILIQLMDDANVNHVAEPAPYTRSGKPHITYTTFTAALDSDGVAWVDNDIAITIREGVRYSDFLGDFMRLGYEFGLRPDPVTDGQWQLLAYNPGAKGIDRSALTHPAITAGQSTVGGPVTRTRIPGNWLFVRGQGGLFDVDTSAGSVTAVGHQESYVQALDVVDQQTIDLRASEEVQNNVNSGLSLKLKLAPTSDLHSIPLRDFDVGDTINVSVPEILPKAPRRVESIQFTFLANPGDDAALSFDVSFISEAFTSGGGGGGGTSGDVATREAVRRILRKLERVTPIPEVVAVDTPLSIGGAGGGAPDLVIAGSNQIQSSKDRADFICSGTGDAAVINQAAALLTAGGRILLTGTFNCTETLTVPTGVSLVGMGWEATKLVFTAVTVAGEAIGLGVRSNLHDLKVDISGSPGGFVRAIDLGVESRISGVWVESDVGVGIADSGGENYITGCHIDGTMATGIEVVSGGVMFISDTFIEGAALGVTITGGGECVITNCVMECDDAAIRQSGNIDLRVSSCFLRGFDIAGVEIDASSGWVTFNGCRIKGLGSAPGMIISAITGAVGVHGCYIDGSGGAVILDDVADVQLVGNQMVSPTLCISGLTEGEVVRIADNNLDGGGIELDNFEQVEIVGNTILNSATAIRLDYALGVTDARYVIADNIISITTTGGIQIVSTGTLTEVSITGNLLVGCVGAGVLLEQVNDATVEGNRFHQTSGAPTIFLDTCLRVNVDGNSLHESGQHGIRLLDSSHCVIQGNLITEASSTTADTYDGIILDGNSDENHVHGNKIVSTSQQTRIGINIQDGTCNCNVVVANMLGDVLDYGFDALVNGGSDTQLFWPGHAVYGDNFTECVSGS